MPEDHWDKIYVINRRVHRKHHWFYHLLHVLGTETVCIAYKINTEWLSATKYRGSNVYKDLDETLVTCSPSRYCRSRLMSLWVDRFASRYCRSGLMPLWEDRVTSWQCRSGQVWEDRFASRHCRSGLMPLWVDRFASPGRTHATVSG
jgi:hypothetical protein